MRAEKMEEAHCKYGRKILCLGGEKGRKLSLGRSRRRWVTILKWTLKKEERKIRTGSAGSGVELL